MKKSRRRVIWLGAFFVASQLAASRVNTRHARWRYDTRMRRRNVTIIITLLLLLSGGAIVNVAVAWGCAAWLPQDSWVDEKVVEAPTEWPAYLQQLGWQEPTSAIERRMGIGVVQIGISGGDPEASWKQSGPGTDKTWVSLHVRQFGIPSRALQWELHGVRAGPRGMEMTNAAHEAAGRRTGIDISSMNADGSITLRSLPLIPVFPGFIINTVFYAAILWLLFLAPITTRRMIRRRRGQCEKCAYPIGVRPVCTECGAAVRPKSNE